MKRLSISQAIKQTRKEVLDHTEWDEGFGMIYDIIRPPEYSMVQFRKLRRIRRALKLLGVRDYEIQEYLSTIGPGSMEELVRAYFK